MVIVLIFIFSILIASFYNVCIHRMIINQSVVFPSSYCPSCHHPLKPLDLIPIFSYIFLLGRCRYCKGRISLRYFMVEIITPILAIFLYGIYGVSWQFIGYFVLASLLIITSFIDIEQQIYTK